LPDDAKAIVEILNPIIEARVYTVFDAPFTIETEREYIQDFPKRGVFLVAVRKVDNKLVGLQSIEPFDEYTRTFNHVGVMGTYVDLKFHRLGIAGCLFEATFAAALLKGYEKIFTYIRADNLTALKAYTNQGFQIVGTAKKQAKIDGKYIDEVVIEKFLTE